MIHLFEFSWNVKIIIIALRANNCVDVCRICQYFKLIIDSSWSIFMKRALLNIHLR